MKRIIFATIMLFALVTCARFVEAPILERFGFSRLVRDRNQRPLRFTLSGDEKYRLYTPLDEIPPQLIEALLLHEDRHFYSHFGVNPLALTKAAFNTYIRGTRRMGGSTVTMQLVRLLHTQGSKNIAGKVLQSARAIYLDATHSKREILEAYLNLLPFGRNIEGIGAASLLYFGKSVRELSLAEILSLAVIPQNPNARNLWEIEQANQTPSTRHYQESRRHLVGLWNEAHPEAAGQNLLYDLPLLVRNHSFVFRAPHFVNTVLEKARGDRANPVIDTTLDLELQDLGEKILSNYVTGKSDLGVHNAAMMIVDIKTMDVLAAVGSRDFNDPSIGGQVNGTLALRSPGSTLKPLVYALAFDQGLIHPLSLLKDTPIAFGGFDPENFDRKFVGPVTATDALIKSRNVPAVYLSSLLEEKRGPTLYSLLKQTSTRKLREPQHYGLALTLGAAEISMSDLVKLYGALGNFGEWRELRYTLSDPAGSPRKLFSAEAAFLTLDILRQNPRDEQRQLDGFLRDSIPIAWKTGTSFAFRDAWTIGLVGSYAVAVWLGNFNGDENPALVGRDMAAPLFFRLADALKSRVKKNISEVAWRSPQGLNLKRVKVCAISGSLPNHHCQHQLDTWFIPAVSPIAECQVHREILINKRTGLQACDSARPDVVKEVFEFWPSDILKVFRLAGVPRRAPPLTEPSCSLSAQSGVIPAPQIMSPRRGVTYQLRSHSATSDHDDSVVPLTAVTDGSIRRLHWFVGKEYVGRSGPDTPLFWKLKVGHYEVRVVDDAGQSDSRSIDVVASQ